MALIKEYIWIDVKINLDENYTKLQYEIKQDY